MNKQQLLARINEIILESNGTVITFKDNLADTHLDSLSTVLLLTELDNQFSLSRKGTAWIDTLYIPSLTIKDLIVTCLT